MNAEVLEILACPGCARPLAEGAGALTCAGCGARYPIVAGVPRLLPPSLTDEARETASRFGYEWTRFAEVIDEYERQFLGWIAPLGPEAFKDQVVLDAGCGKGRHLRLAARWGARRAIGIDLGVAVEAAAVNTADAANVTVLQGDLVRTPLAPASVDLVYCIGVLHHLREPLVGLRALVRLLRPGGRIVIWVYGHEGNGWVRALVNPVRAVTSRVPLPLVRALAAIAAVPLWMAVRGLYGPVAAGRGPAWLRGRLPYAAYLDDLAPFPYRELHAITFDHLLAPIAHYVRAGEVRGWFEAAGLELTVLRQHHRNSWTAVGCRPAAGGSG
jgi:SAM-dependent methyltransferase